MQGRLSNEKNTVAPTIEVATSNGKTIYSSGDHPITVAIANYNFFRTKAAKCQGKFL